MVSRPPSAVEPGCGWSRELAYPRLAWSRDCNDYEGMVVALLLVAAIAAIWWLVGHKGWGAVQKLVFWVVLLVVLWVLVAVYGVPHPSG